VSDLVKKSAKLHRRLITVRTNIVPDHHLDHPCKDQITMSVFSLHNVLYHFIRELGGKRKEEEEDRTKICYVRLLEKNRSKADGFPHHDMKSIF
jgi:hypothetical protein